MESSFSIAVVINVVLPAPVMPSGQKTEEVVESHQAISLLLSTNKAPLPGVQELAILSGATGESHFITFL